MKMVWMFSVLVSVLVSVSAHPSGPPPEACETMFPTGHGADAMTSDPPYVLEVTGGPLNKSNHKLTVTLKVKEMSNDSYFKGMFVQARMASCYNDKSFGTFSLIDKNDNYLRVMDCHHRKGNAISHKASMRIYDGKTFEWFSPNTSLPGHLFFRATVVKNKTTFWTNVFSEVIKDESDDRDVPTAYTCDVCTKQGTCSAPSFAAVTSLIVVALGLALSV